MRNTQPTYSLHVGSLLGLTNFESYSSQLGNYLALRSWGYRVMQSLFRIIMCIFVVFTTVPAQANPNCPDPRVKSAKSLPACHFGRTGNFPGVGCGGEGGTGWRDLDSCDCVGWVRMRAVSKSPDRYRQECLRAEVGEDQSRRSAVFEIVVVNEDLHWAYKDTRLASADDEIRQLLRERLAKAKSIIAVGTASCEGNRKDEVARAETRAKAAMALVAQEPSLTTDVSLLNLGQFVSKDCGRLSKDETATQRPFVLIAVRSETPVVNLEEALKDALSKGSSLLPIGKYSHFLLQPSLSRPTTTSALGR
jgi:hypothetical protein